MGEEGALGSGGEPAACVSALEVGRIARKPAVAQCRRAARSGGDAGEGPPHGGERGGETVARRGTRGGRAEVEQSGDQNGTSRRRSPRWLATGAEEQDRPFLVRPRSGTRMPVVPTTAGVSVSPICQMAQSGRSDLCPQTAWRETSRGAGAACCAGTVPPVHAKGGILRAETGAGRHPPKAIGTPAVGACAATLVFPCRYRCRCR